jgi:hypothetical protein
VLGLSVHAPANIADVGEYGALVAVPVDRGWGEGVSFRTGEGESRVCSMEGAKEAIQEL